MKIFTNGTDFFATDNYIKNLTPIEINSINKAVNNGICPYAIIGAHDMVINRFDELIPWEDEAQPYSDFRSIEGTLKIDFTDDMDSIDILIELIKSCGINNMPSLNELEINHNEIFKTTRSEGNAHNGSVTYIFEGWKNRIITIKVDEDNKLSYTLIEPENQNSLDSEAKHLRGLNNSKKITEREICAIYKVDNLEDGDKSTLSQTEIETLKFKEETLDKLERAIKVVGIQRERRENK